MEINVGVQPNCSELVIYIKDHTKDEVMQILQENNIREVIANNYYSYGNTEVGDWDDEQIEREVVELTPETKKLWDRYDHELSDLQSDAGTKLRELGFDPWKSTVMLIDENGVPSWEHGGSVSLYDHHDDHNGPAIVAHQHCQEQLFPLMKKISEIFAEEPQGYDGGSSQFYEEWLNEQTGVGSNPDL